MSDPLSSKRSCWRLAAGLFVVALFAFSGRLESSDEILMGATSHAIAWRASLSFPEIYGQTFTGYGIGTPLAGVPLAWIEGALRRAGIIGESANISLLPLLNAVLFAWIGALAAGLTRRFQGDDAWISRATFLAVIASPLLPSSATFTSEPLACLGLIGAAWALAQRPDDRRWWVVVAPAFFAAAGISARLALLPLVAIVAVWGWRGGASKRQFVSLAVGVGIALTARAAQNWALRGSPFAQGYDGQEFTTPVFTGVMGLLFSPERGVAIFCPLLLIVLINGAGQNGNHATDGSLWSSYRNLVAETLLFALVFHGKFWTWHGGWSLGPRFLLPVIVLGLPLMAKSLGEWRLASSGFRLLAAAAFVWGLWGSILYTLLSPMEWWNELWNFHQIESRWLFEPGLSLWSGWPALMQDSGASALSQDSRWKPFLLKTIMDPDIESMFYGVLISVFLLISPVSALLIAYPAESEKRLAIPLFVLLFVFCCGALRGPRGWGGDIAEADFLLSSSLRLSNERYKSRCYAWLDARAHGTYGIFGKAEGGDYRVLVDDKTMFQNKVQDRHLFQSTFDNAESRMIPIEVFFEPDEARPNQLRLYWTWPGEGHMMEPIGGEYVLPRELTPLERAATAVWRRKTILFAGVLALLLLLPSKRKGPSAS